MSNTLKLTLKSLLEKTDRETLVEIIKDDVSVQQVMLPHLARANGLDMRKIDNIVKVGENIDDPTIRSQTVNQLLLSFAV